MCSLLNNSNSYNFDTEGQLSVDDFYTSKLMKLMPYKIHKVLLVASLYDSFLLEEDGRLEDLLNNIYKIRDLGYVPIIIRVTTNENALEQISKDSFDLTIYMIRGEDSAFYDFIESVKRIKPDIPVVILAYNNKNIENIMNFCINNLMYKIFYCQGEGKILAYAIQLIEDQKNAEHDTENFSVPNILVVEDSIDFYSRYLPIFYEILWDQTKELLKDNLTNIQKKLRQRGRPKIHLATNYEEAMNVYEKFKNNMLGIITDISFPRHGVIDKNAGLSFIEKVKEYSSNIPIIIQSSEDDIVEEAKKLNAGFILKTSPTLINDFKLLFINYFGFEDMIFKNKNGIEISRISNIDSFISVIDSLPQDILFEYYHLNVIKRWLLVRTEFEIVKKLYSEEIIKLKDQKILREKIKEIIDEHISKSHYGSIVPYSRRMNIKQWHFYKIGGGSIGGKARGLAFIDKILNMDFVKHKFPEINISIPRTLVLGTDVFDEFIKINNLLKIGINESYDNSIANAFINAQLPPTVVGDLLDFIRNVNSPLAIRSSSLLEDSLYQPFAGIYLTKMIPNNEIELTSRFLHLTNAIKLVYASTFFKQPKAYIESTNHNIEDEKMAVIIQEVVGNKRGNYFYPNISGVAKSLNYYPSGNAKPEDGIVNTALGLGKIVVSGESTLSFIPNFPKILFQYSSPAEILNHSQRDFYAIIMKPFFTTAFTDEDQFIEKLNLKTAEEDGVLDLIGSTYSSEDNRIYDNINISGPRIISFAKILKYDYFPLANITKYLLKICQESIGCPVEIEYAISIQEKDNTRPYFGFLQVRPLVSENQLVNLDVSKINTDEIFSLSTNVLGNGIINDICDIIYVKTDTFNPSDTKNIADEIGKLNTLFRNKNLTYILIGPGRWGTSDQWLGIPVKWDQISKARTIIEISLPNMSVDYSQGSHFFHNITSLNIGYFSILRNNPDNFIDLEWLNRQKPLYDGKFIRHVRLENPLIIKMDGRISKGLIKKPINYIMTSKDKEE